MPTPLSMSSIVDQEELSAAEAEFVHNLAAVGLSAPKAAAAAGYESKSAHLQLLQDPRIRTAITKQYERNRKVVNFTREDVLEGMKEAIDLARMSGEPATMVRGWSEIGKIIGAYERANTITINVNQVNSVEDLKTLSVEELAELVARSNQHALPSAEQEDSQ